MKRFLSLLFTLLFCCLLTACGPEKEIETFTLPEQYQLAYSDEFDSPIDTSVWHMFDHWPRKGGYWSAGQVAVDSGNLMIRTEYVDQGEQSGYYTGGLRWHTKRSTYGYYEIRCRVEDVRGAWSAFWLMPDNINQMEQKAQDGCEIDIFESALPDKIQNTLHFDAYTAQKKRITKVEDLYDGFHIFALDWKKDSMKFYYDNRLLWEITNPDLISRYPVSMEISTEINGKVKNGVAESSRWLWLGCGDIQDKGNRLPAQFVVDYVRVYDNGELVWSEKEA